MDCKFNLTKFEGVVVLTMTPDMTKELLDCLEDFEDFDDCPHAQAAMALTSLRRSMRGIINHKGRSIVHRRERIVHREQQPENP